MSMLSINKWNKFTLSWTIFTFMKNRAVFSSFPLSKSLCEDSHSDFKLIGFGLSAEVLIWVALGGRHVLLAAFLSAAAVRWIEGVLSGALGEWWLLALGAVFMVSVVLLPRGLLATPLLWLGGRLTRQGRRS